MEGLRVWQGGRLQMQGPQESSAMYGSLRSARRPWKTISGLSLVVLACLVTTVYSQRLTLTPSLSVEERYDDNIFQASRRTSDTEDFVTRLTPGIRVQYLSTEPAPDTRLDFDYQAAIDIFADHGSQNQVAHRVALALSSQLSRSLAARVRELLIVTEEPFGRQERLDEPTGLRPGSLQQRSRTIRNELLSGLDVNLGARTSLGARFESLIEDVSTEQELDEFRYTLGVELGYLVNPVRESRALLAYQVSFHSFRDNDLIAPENVSSDFQVHVISPGLRHHLTPTLTTNIALGYTFTTSDDIVNDDHKAFYANLGLTKTFQAGEVSLGYLRHFRSGEARGGVVLFNTLRGSVAIDLTGKLTARVDGNLSWSDFQSRPTSDLNQFFRSVRPSVTYRITSPWSVSVAYAFERTDYREDAIADIDDHRLVLGTQFALNEWLSLGLAYRYTTRQTARSSFGGEVSDFSRNQVGLTISASPNIRF